MMKALRILAMFTLLWPICSLAQDDARDAGAMAALFKPYIDCVAEKARAYSSGTDAASDIAVAAMHSCQDLEKSSFSETKSMARELGKNPDTGLHLDSSHVG